MVLKTGDLIAGLVKSLSGLLMTYESDWWDVSMGFLITAGRSSLLFVGLAALSGQSKKRYCREIKAEEQE